MKAPTRSVKQAGGRQLSRLLNLGNPKTIPYDAPLFAFNAVRSEIKLEVSRRMYEHYLHDTSHGIDSHLNGESTSPLGYTLNRLCYTELSRLKRSSSFEDEIHDLEWWNRLARRLTRMTETEKRDILRSLIEDYAEDTAGNFDLNVFSFTTGFVPALIGALFKTQDMSEWVLKPHRIREGIQQLRDLSDRLIIEGATDHVRALSNVGTIVVVPTHSSNMDSILVGWALHDRSIPPVTYGAGKNLFRNPLLTFFMHNLGAYKIDRRIQNHLYKDLLKTYSQVILERGFHSLFFPGGTRSRSNRVETDLKLGLLGSTVAAYSHNLVHHDIDSRVFLCPLTINYTLVMEAESLIREYLRQEGGPRYFLEGDPFNSLTKVSKFAFNTVKMRATTIVRFGEPMDPFGNRVDRNGNSIDNRGRHLEPKTYIQSGLTGKFVEDPQRNQAYTRHTGEEIARSFKRNTVLLPSQVVSWALFQHVVDRQPELDIFQILKADQHDPVSWRILYSLVDSLSLELRLLHDKGEVRVVETIYSNDTQQTIDEGLVTLQTYHVPPILRLSGAGIFIHRLDLLYFYRNRIDTFPLNLNRIQTRARSML